MPQETPTSATIDQFFWSGRRVFVTGHTGFKGSWLCMMLARMGATVSGYALMPPSEPNLFELANIGDGMTDVRGDIRDLRHLTEVMVEQDPEIVVHMAAQALVRSSYDDPVGTYETNIMGTVNVLEAARKLKGLKALVVITSDKCYENFERPRGYAEDDPMGGYDPYSSSKGCAELVSAAYQKSFFSKHENDVRVATARAGNVIGGGDWGLDRLVPDLVNSFKEGDTALIRRPDAIRPWQFVLDPLCGYLMLAERLWCGDAGFAGAWNFGPHADNERRVRELVALAGKTWGDNAAWSIDVALSPHEAHYLKLDVSKARNQLHWQAQLNLQQTVAWTMNWYKVWANGGDVRRMAMVQIEEFLVLKRGPDSDR